MRTFADKAYDFFISLEPAFSLPKGFDFLLPGKKEEARKLTLEFLKKFYDDSEERIFIFGINPGRFGGGTTGISFTDPIRLENDCGISNSLQKKPELSSNFIYEMIKEYGGTKKFFSSFYLTAVCPVGFTKDGNNINYYDDKNLLQSSKSFIVSTIHQQMKMGTNKNSAICLGEGKNYDYLSKLNDELELFQEIIPLAHPRFIMQYKRKMMSDYISKYQEVLTKARTKKSKPRNS